MCVGVMGTALASPLYPIYQQAWGLRPSDITMVFVVYMFGTLTSLLFLGRLTQRHGFLPILRTGLALMTAGVPIDLPDSNASALPQESEQVVVSIDEQGYVYIDDAAVPVGGLPDALAALPRTGAEGPDITLRADRALDYGRVMAVMGELNRAGLNRISLITNAGAASGGADAAPVTGGSSTQP